MKHQYISTPENEQYVTEHHWLPALQQKTGPIKSNNNNNNTFFKIKF